MFQISYLEDLGSRTMAKKNVDARCNLQGRRRDRRAGHEMTRNAANEPSLSLRRIPWLPPDDIDGELHHALNSVSDWLATPQIQPQRSSCILDCRELGPIGSCNAHQP